MEATSIVNTKEFLGKGEAKYYFHNSTRLGSDSGDEELITTVGLHGKSSFHASSSSTHVSHDYERIMSELFHIRVVAKNTNIETLFDPGSQVNLIS